MTSVPGCGPGVVQGVEYRRPQQGELSESDYGHSVLVGCGEGSFPRRPRGLQCCLPAELRWWGTALPLGSSCRLGVGPRLGSV